MSFGQIARLSAVMLLSITVLAQNGAPKPITITPEEQAAFKPLHDAEVKALADLNAAMTKLPEFKAYDAAKIAKLRKAYQLMANNKLSSQEYVPQVTEKGELVFPKIVKAP